MSDLEQVFRQPNQSFDSVDMMREWLVAHGVSIAEAESRKGLNRLYEKLQCGEARLAFDRAAGRVYRSARVVRISVRVTLQGETYPLIELCQIYLSRKISRNELDLADPKQIANLLKDLSVRSAQVRNSQEVWETLVGDENAELGAVRGLVEELGVGSEDAVAALSPIGSGQIEYEEPIDWPGIHSILEIYPYHAVLSPQASRPAYCELQGGEQITIFVAAPNAALVQELLKQIFPKIRYD